MKNTKREEREESTQTEKQSTKSRRDKTGNEIHKEPECR